MEVSDLILADYADAHQLGKFTLVGAGINNVFTNQVPYTHPLVFLFIRFKITRLDIGLNKIDIKLVGESGSVFRAEADLNVAANHKDEQQLPISIRMQNTKFQVFGKYEFQVSINGELRHSQIFSVTKTPEASIASA